MMEQARIATDQPAQASSVAFEMDVLVGRILQVGVLLSMILIVIGLTWHWGSTGHLRFAYPIAGVNFFQFVLSGLRQVSARAFEPRLLINLGIVTLMLTPYVRVAASMLFFAAVERNWKYTLFTGFVFAVLTYSLILR